MNDIKRQLKQLRHMEPGAEWKKQQWAILREQLGQEKIVQLSLGKKALRLLQHPSVFKPLGNMAVIALVMLVGSWSAVASAQRSVPGNWLYAVKVGLERVELALTVDNNAKVAKQTYIAKQRVAELTTITARGGLPVVRDDVDRTVKDIRRNLEDAQSRLSALSAKGGDEKLAVTAAEVEREVAAIGKSFNEIAKSLPAEVRLSVSQEIESVEETITDTSDHALGVVINQGLLTDIDVEESQIVERLEERLAAIQSMYDEIDIVAWQGGLSAEGEQSVPPENVEAVIALYEYIGAQWELVQGAILQKNYIGALNQMGKVRDELKTLQNMMNNPNVLGEEEVVTEDAVDANNESAEIEETTSVVNTSESTEVVKIEIIQPPTAQDSGEEQ